MTFHHLPAPHPSLSNFNSSSWPSLSDQDSPGLSHVLSRGMRRGGQAGSNPTMEIKNLVEAVPCGG